MTSRDDKKTAIEQWEQVCVLLRSEIGDDVFKSWFEQMSLDGIYSGEVRLCVPTRFLREWILANYVDTILSLWNTINPEIHSVNFAVKLHSSKNKIIKKQPANPNKPDTAKPIAETFNASSYQAENKHNSISSILDKRFTFDNFVVGKPNEFAYAAACKIAEQDTISFNPLYLYSGVGLGKTHLMHAIALHIKEKSPNRTVAYLSAEKFMYRFVSAMRNKNTMPFKEQLRSVDVLMIDDIQFFSGKDSTQEEFFHTFNSLVDQGKQVVIAADKHPSELDRIEERLISRLNSGLIADIHPTSYELRLGILESKSELLNAAVPPKVLEFLAHKITSNVRELEGALRRIIAHSQMLGCEITLEKTKDILSDMLRSFDRRLTIEEIQKKVAEHFNIKISEMSSARRARVIARPRQVAMYLSKQLTPLSLPVIGRKFGGRDHTTVMYAVSKIEELIKKDTNFAEEVELLKRILEN
ncbi:MAG: chromosomal replication initiator protein DnaA [Alphaproteobacteria bacterium]|nr:chromosomal replication initiator protein DnaA [Alphaproteobacteria bacterium]